MHEPVLDLGHRAGQKLQQRWCDRMQRFLVDDESLLPCQSLNQISKWHIVLVMWRSRLAEEEWVAPCFGGVPHILERFGSAPITF